MLSDADSGVRAAAIVAIGAINNEDATTLSRPLLADPDPRIRVTAAVALAASASPADVDAAEATLIEIAGDSRDSARTGRRDVAAAIRHIGNPRFRRLLIPMLYDPSPEVADEAMESVQAAGASDFVFVPTLIALLRNRRLKARARQVLVSYGEPVVAALAHFMRDEEEDIWVRRHIPATLAQIPSQQSVDVLTAALSEPDGFLRYKVVAALDRLRRTDSPLTFPREAIEALALREGRRYFNYLSLFDNLTRGKTADPGSLLGHAVQQKMARTQDRIYRLLALVYPWKDIAAAEWTLHHGDARSRASASEYLDNILTGQLRKYLMPILEELPQEDKVRRGNVLLKTRPRDIEETLLQLINDEDQVVAAAAIDLVRQLKLWALADDVEHVLAFRDARDWYVFEAASWALAERRMPAERRRELWLEPLPAAELAGRLRGLPLFASVSRRRAVPDRRGVPPGSPPAGHDPAAGRDRARDDPHSPRRPGHRPRPGHVRRRRALHDRVARDARLRSVAAGPADAPVDEDHRERRHAGAHRRRAAHAARGQHRAGAGTVRHARRRASMPRWSATCNRRGPAASWSSSPPRGCCRSRRSSRCSACRSSRGSPSKRCGRSPTSPRPSR